VNFTPVFDELVVCKIASAHHENTELDHFHSPVNFKNPLTTVWRIHSFCRGGRPASALMTTAPIRADPAAARRRKRLVHAPTARTHGLKAMPGTVRPLTSFCLVWLANGFAVGRQTKMPLSPQPRSGDSRISAGAKAVPTSALPSQRAARKPWRIPTPVYESETWVESPKPGR
jgi:hypothetical protein